MEWIRVEDRLPEKGVYVLGYGKNTTLGGLHYEQVKRNSDGCWCSVVNYSHVRITHWIPLPDPPKS